MATTITSVASGSVVALGNIPLTEDVYTAGQVETRLSDVAGVLSQEIASAVSTAWKAGGAISSGTLSTSGWEAGYLISGNEGKVYNLNEDYVTPADGSFVEGGNVHIEAGTDIAVINTAASGDPASYKFTILGTTDSSVVKSIALGTSSGETLTPTNGAVTIPLASHTSGYEHDGLMSSGDKSKLDGIASGANLGFSSVVAGSGTIQASGINTSLYVVGGGNVTVSGDATNGRVVISVPDATGQTKGVVEVAQAISDTGTVVPTAALVSGAISGAVSGLVSGGTLHSGLVANGLSNPSTAPTSGTIFALVKALHASDNQSESAA